MPDLKSKLGSELLKAVADLRESKGEISLQDVGNIFINMAESLNPEHSNVDLFVHQEIARLASYIANAKGEIFAIQTNDNSEAVITDASAHLDEVIKHTEEATNTIMDAADKIQEAAAGVGGEKEESIMAASTAIYDACTFQDITGQRIRKVIKLLQHIEERIGKLNDLFGETPQFAVEEGAKTLADARLPANDKDLLNGPQLKGQGIGQDDIDALFGNVKNG